MKIRFLFFLLWAGCFSSVLASHIVGGEFELLHVSGSTYRVNLIIYFDQINGNPGAKDPSANISIFQKSNNQLITNLQLSLAQELNVDYTQPECSHGEIVTRKLIYTSTITLSPSVYNDPAGYYLVWQRCCRNYTITNIFSPEPVPGGVYAGQTFYLEFPPVVKNGEPFINSSPYLFPPLNDYACPGKPYYVDFAGIDNDGDSLVYTMVTPLNTKTLDALPPVSGGPYPNVTWKPGYSLNDIIHGSPDLRISKQGLLTATPQVQGLFVFAVKVEEFRNKEKIGESRRDFQMLVVDGCAHAEPPVIKGKKTADAEFIYDKEMSVSFDNTVADEDRCIQVRISDPDASNPMDNFVERVGIRAIGINFFNKNVKEILPAEVSKTLVNGSTAEFSICFPACPLLPDGHYEVGIIAMDDACSLPLTDTLKVNVFVQPPNNTIPYFVTSRLTTQQLNEGDNAEWTFRAQDDDGDSLHLAPLTNGFVLANAGMTVEILDQADGYIEGKLKWDAFCDIYDFTQHTEFQVSLAVEDVDKCELENPDVAVYNLSVKLPGNADPYIDTSLTPDPLERFVNGIERSIFTNLNFTVTGEDPVDNDYLEMDLVNKATWAEYGVTFAKAEGNSAVQSTFDWDLECNTVDFDLQNTFDFQFILVDNKNKCRLYKADTVNVNVTVVPPDNHAPVIVVNGIEPQIQLSPNSPLEVTLGQQIVLGIQGADIDDVPKKDKIVVELIKATGNVAPSGYVFETVSGEGNVSTTFSWNPQCNIFQNDVYENNYEFTFRIFDDHCHSEEADTVAVKIKIKDVDGSDNGFTPVNFFSPNGDGFNDYYSMERLDEEGNLQNILPLDNCTSQFQAIRVYNRWGNQVFSSTDRNFKWFAEGEAAGVYYYLIQYSNKEYKGALSIRY